MVGRSWELLEATGPPQSGSVILRGHIELKFKIDLKKKTNR